MMSDKKVERHSRSSESERPIGPTEKLQESLSDTGTLNTEEPDKGKAKAKLLDKFREREERIREEERRQQEQATAEPAGRAGES
jgi:hypothetical protein